MIGTRKAQDLYQATFSSIEKQLTSDAWSWSQPLRRSAIAGFAEVGFPTTKLEDWKFTNLEAIAKIPFQPAKVPTISLTVEELISVRPQAAAARHRLVFVNGYFSDRLSLTDQLPEGVAAESLGLTSTTHIELIESHLARYASSEGRPLVALNTAFMQDGALVRVAKGAYISEPIHLIFVTVRNGSPILISPRNLVVLESGAQAQIVESYVAISDEAYLTNAVTEVVAGADSVLEYYKLQDDSNSGFHIDTLQINQERGSNVTSHAVTLGGELVRNDLNVVLNGEGADCSLNGLYITGGTQHVDNHTVIDHAKAHGTSRELYKGILDGKSSAVFNGSIIVRKDAQRTDARQNNKNLLLSSDAAINSKPQLEINADDVKCAHGTSIGHLDEGSVFYLRSRGIGEDEARSVLTYGFANEVLKKMKVREVREVLEGSLLSRLAQIHSSIEA